MYYKQRLASRELICAQARERHDESFLAELSDQGIRVRAF